MIKNKLDKQFRICTDSFRIQTFMMPLDALHFQSDNTGSDRFDV